MDQSSKKNPIFNFGMVLGLKFFLERNAKELHYGLLNILLLASTKCSDYCFCKYYEDRLWKTGRRTDCALCKSANDSYEFEKRCNYTRLDFDTLCQIAKEILPYLEECFEVGDHEKIFELSDDEYSSCIRKSDGSKTETTLTERIKFDIELEKLNGRMKYLDSIYK